MNFSKKKKQTSVSSLFNNLCHIVVRRKNRTPWVSFPLSPTTLTCQASLLRLIHNCLQTIIDEWGQVSLIQPREGEGKVNNSQHCWPNNVETTCNRVCKWTQHVTNIQQCWVLLVNNRSTTHYL